MKNSSVPFDFASGVRDVENAMPLSREDLSAKPDENVEETQGIRKRWRNLPDLASRSMILSIPQEDFDTGSFVPDLGSPLVSSRSRGRHDYHHHHSSHHRHSEKQRRQIDPLPRRKKERDESEFVQAPMPSAPVGGALASIRPVSVQFSADSGTFPMSPGTESSTDLQSAFSPTSMGIPEAIEFSSSSESVDQESFHEA